MIHKNCCHRYALIYFCLVYFPFTSFAQVLLRGRLIDEISNEPVANASVYFNNSKLSTLSDSLGRFNLPINTDQLELIITHISYQKAKVNISNNAGEITARLQRKVASLQGVMIEPKEKNGWDTWGRLFTQYFIGTESKRKQYVIVNPEAIQFFYRKKEMKLKAISDEPLILDNNLLGYRVFLDIDSFVYSFQSGLFNYVISKRFQELQPTDEAQRLRFAANRLIAFKGSSMHFFRALYKKTLTEEGFRISKFSATSNSQKLRVEATIQKYIAMNKIRTTINLDAFGPDSAGVYRYFLRQPTYYKTQLTALNALSRWKTSENNLVKFDTNFDTLLIQYSPQPDNGITYQQIQNRAGTAAWGNPQFQSNLSLSPNNRSLASLMYLRNEPMVLLDRSGNVLNKESLIFEGNLADRRIAYELPWEYYPDEDLRLLLSSVKRKHS